jgi:hypothetical protein
LAPPAFGTVVIISVMQTEEAFREDPWCWSTAAGAFDEIAGNDVSLPSFAIRRAKQDAAVECDPHRS